MAREAVAAEPAIVAGSAEFDRLDSRVAFGRALGKIAENDPQVMAVVSDYGRRLALDALRSKLPGSVVQCGIAEQNQVEVASALANEGFHVFAPSYAPFITARVLDQVRVNLGMMESPAVLVGLGAGYHAGILGPSHMALEDLACMRSIPGLTVVAPATNTELACALAELAKNPRPAYVRITQAPAGDPALPSGDFELGRCRVLVDDALGRTADVAIASCGSITSRALAATELLRRRGLSCRMVAVGTVKPLDQHVVALLANARLAVTVEEHSVVGGLGGLLAEELLDRGAAPGLLRLGAPDSYPEADEQARLLERAGLTTEGMAASILARLG